MYPTCSHLEHDKKLIKQKFMGDISKNRKCAKTFGIPELNSHIARNIAFKHKNI